VPEDAKPGLYRGAVSVWDDGFDLAVQIPVALRILPFRLDKDPAKHYSTYYYVRNRTQYAGKPDSFIRAAADNEYRTMVAYGQCMAPTMQLACDDDGKIILLYSEELDRMLAAGLSGPVPVTAGNVIARFYRDTTPDGRRESHWQISKLPPPEFYERITIAFQAFEAQRKTNGWPEFVCCPIDEVTAAQKEFGAKVYAAVKSAGIRTYATKDPTAADAAPYEPYIDVWCSQPYSVPYEKIAAQDRYEYWCYPNHNAGEIKDRRVMCKGGRMTYGFGFWRSGYTTLIPWNWSWTPGDDQFDYLRGTRSGCGQRIDEDGQVIPSIYWDCFREGNDDARYVYTLQQAVFQREGSPSAECLRAVAGAKSLLQATWDAIDVQQKYLADGMWPSEEFNTRRWLLARAITELLRYPAVRSGAAPSVLVANTSLPEAQAGTSVIDRALQAGNVQPLDLGEDFAAWSNGTAEGAIEIAETAEGDAKKELLWRIRVDHQTDGGEGGQYPIGWPRVARSFPAGELDLTAYDYLSLWVRVDSNRDEVADDSTRLGLSIASHGQPRRLYETSLELGDRQRQWIPLRFSLRELIDATGVGQAPWQSVSRVQLFIAENNYADGTELVFQVRDVQLLRFASPVIQSIKAPEYILLPRTSLPVQMDILGTRSVRKGSHTVVASLTSTDGHDLTTQQQDLLDGPVVLVDTSAFPPGRHQLNLTITDANGATCAHEAQSIEAVDGPPGDQ
jgi:hypothetical protein